MATAVAHFKISYAEAARKALSYDMIFKFKENPNAPYLLFMSWVQSEEGKQFGENKPIRHIIRSANDPRAITCYCVGKRYVLWKDGSVSVDTPDQTVSCSDQERELSRKIRTWVCAITERTFMVVMKKKLGASVIKSFREKDDNGNVLKRVSVLETQ